jgi:hypothetical protein
MADDDDTPSRGRAMIGLAVILLMLLGGWFIAQRLARTSRVEDCLMSGRRNCAPIDQHGVVQPPR